MLPSVHWLSMVLHVQIYVHAGEKEWGEKEKKNRLGVKINGNKFRIIYPETFRISDVIVQCELHQKSRLIIEQLLF